MPTVSNFGMIVNDEFDGTCKEEVLFWIVESLAGENEIKLQQYYF